MEAHPGYDNSSLVAATGIVEWCPRPRGRGEAQSLHVLCSLNDVRLWPQRTPQCEMAEDAVMIIMREEKIEM